jgi:Domain of unknown function (DUF1963)
VKLVLFQRLLDLGDAGAMAFTLDISAQLPLPAARHGFARWHPWQGPAQDRTALFSRVLQGEEFAASANAQRQRLAAAEASLRERVEHIVRDVGQAQAPYAHWPQHAHTLAGGNALLVFHGTQAPVLFRIVDVPNNRVLSEIDIDTLRQRLDVRVTPHMPRDPVVYAHSDEHVSLFLGGHHPTPCRVAGGELTPLALPWVQHPFDLQFTPGFVVEHERGSKAGRAVALGAQSSESAVELKSSPANRSFEVSTARRADRIVLGQARGLLKVVDLPAGGSRLLRPVPGELGADPAAVALAPGGRWLMHETAHGSGTVVDIDSGRAADLTLPHWEFEIPSRRPEDGATLQPAWLLCDRGLLTLDEGHLEHLPFDAMPWRALPEEGTQPRRGGTPAPDAAVLEALRLPALKLLPPPRQQADHGPAPEHDGRPMLLLCEVDLAKACAKQPGLQLPSQGCLTFWVAAQADGEPALDETFEPVAWQVQHHVQALPRSPHRVAACRFDMPPPDHVRALTAFTDAAQVQRYAAWYDRRHPQGPASGWRLGGYATPLQPQSLEAQAAHRAGGQPQDWRLLLQVDSDEQHMWGTDSGMLYFMIDAASLARADFSRVVALSAGL